MCHCSGQSCLYSGEDGHPEKENAEIVSLVQEALRYACTGYGQLPGPFLWLLLGSWAFSFPALASGRIFKGIIYKEDSRPKKISEAAWGLEFKANEWVELRVHVNLFLFMSSCVCSGNVSCVTLSRKLYCCSVA